MPSEWPLSVSVTEGANPPDLSERTISTVASWEGAEAVASVVGDTAPSSCVSRRGYARRMIQPVVQAFLTSRKPRAILRKCVGLLIDLVKFLLGAGAGQVVPK